MPKNVPMAKLTDEETQRLRAYADKFQPDADAAADALGVNQVTMFKALAGCEVHLRTAEHLRALVANLPEWREGSGGRS